MRSVAAAACLVALLVVGAQAAKKSPPSKISPSPAKLTCKSPGDKGVLVHGAKSTIKLEGKGKLIFWCNNSTLDPHGEGGAKLKSADGLYKGEFFYPDDTGIPTYTFNNTKTGVVRTIITKKKPAAGGTASGHSAVNPSRRQVVSDTHTPKASWIVRSHCTGGAKPSSLKCNVDQDVFVPYECLFTVVTC